MSCKGLKFLRILVYITSLGLFIGLFVYGGILINSGVKELGIGLIVAGIVSGFFNALLFLAIIDIFDNLVKNTKDSANNALINASETKELRILVTKLSDELEDLKKAK